MGRAARRFVSWRPLLSGAIRKAPVAVVPFPVRIPGVKTAWTDDNGAVPRANKQINAKLLGKNLQDDLNALLDALNTPGPVSLSTRGSEYRPYRLARSPIASARRKMALHMSPLKCLRQASACSRLRRITRSRRC
ncbi:DNA circularization N-terminal domain-containing protein [Escherichia coli]|uniref:DNA circularization N-terminal domain-containing protein n=1 Tax=Escherichia coli TaxID=562 RepID=UPI002FCD4506